jgi:ubiquinol-cytochrome c reductase iron-sulfur subunit
MSVRSAATVTGLGSADGGFEKDRIQKSAGDPTRREFTYFMLGGARFIYASATRLALIKVCLHYYFFKHNILFMYQSDLFSS